MNKTWFLFSRRAHQSKNLLATILVTPYGSCSIHWLLYFQFPLSLGTFPSATRLVQDSPLTSAPILTKENLNLCVCLSLHLPYQPLGKGNLYLGHTPQLPSLLNSGQLPLSFGWNCPRGGQHRFPQIRTWFQASAYLCHRRPCLLGLRPSSPTVFVSGSS